MPDLTTEELRAALAGLAHAFGCGALQRYFRRNGLTRTKDWPCDRAGALASPAPGA